MLHLQPGINEYLARIFSILPKLALWYKTNEMASDKYMAIDYADVH